MVSSPECDNCGASLKLDATLCAYCGSTLLSAGHTASNSAGNGGRSFGFSGPIYYFVILSVLAGIYGMGWVFEDPRYWLDTRAYIIWCGVVPFWMLSGALFRNSITTPILLGVGISLGLVICHLIIMTLLRGSINDDMVGMAAMVGGSALAGWLAGRFIHHRISVARHQSRMRKTGGQ